MMESGTPPPAPDDCVLVARLGRTRGLRGELYGDAMADEARVLALKRVWLRKSDGGWLNDGQPLEVAAIRPYKGRVVFQFVGIRKIEAAEPFEHSEVVTPRSERPPLAEGEFYLTDLVGCAVLDHKSGGKLGTVTGWQEFGGPEVLEVQPEGEGADGAIWIPFARSICVEIDPAGRRIVVDPPEGLLGLNRELGAPKSDSKVTVSAPEEALSGAESTVLEPVSGASEAVSGVHAGRETAE